MTDSIEEIRLRCFHEVMHPDKHMPQLLSEAKQLEEYVLGKTLVQNNPVHFMDRVKQEAAELYTKLEALKKFIATDIFQQLEDEEQADMEAQCSLMARYHGTLQRRILRYEKNQ